LINKMLFLPGTVAATTYGVTKMCEEDKRRLEEDIGTPATYEHVLKKLDNEVRDVIDEDEEKLMKGANKIASIRKKIDKKERKYMDLEQELAEEELAEAEVEDKKLEKAEEKLLKLQLGQESPVKEKVGEVLHDVKEGVKDVLDKTADYAHLMFASEKELKAREKEAVTPVEDTEDAWPTGKAVIDVPTDSKTQKQLRAAAKRIEDLRKEMSEKRTAIMNEDDELLRKEAEKIDQLHEQLEHELRKYAELQADLTDEMAYELRIREEEKKVKELQLTK